MKDIITGIVFAVFSAAMLYFSQDIRDLGFDPLGPKFLPRLVLVPLLLLSVALIVTGSLKLKAEPEDFPEPNFWQSVRAPALLIVELGAYIWALTSRVVLFEVSSALFILVAGVTLMGFRDRRLLAALVAVAILLPILVGYVFKTYLHVALP